MLLRRLTLLLPLGHEPVESPSALRHVGEPFGCELRAERLMSSRSGPKGLQVERLKAEWCFGVIDKRNIAVSMEVPSTFSFSEDINTF
jgi:hypothetical protein